MLDYYGSIIIDEKDIIKRIVLSYQDKYNTKYIEKIIQDFMDQGIIVRECSVSGWMVFLGKDYIQKVEEKYLKDLDDAKKRLEFSKILHERLSPDKIGNQDPYIVEEILQ